MDNLDILFEMNIGLSGLQIVFMLISILIGMSFHEAMHAFTSHWLGDTTARDEGRLTLNPLEHIDLLTTILLPLGLVLLGLPPFFAARPVPFNPARVRWEEFGAALVGLAGPFSNLLLASVAAIIVRVIGAGTGTDMYMFFSIFIQINIAFFVFNLIPFPPLDGSRLLYALAPEPVQRVMLQIESMGFGAIFIFMFLLFPLLAPVVIQANDFLYTLLLG